MPQTEPSTQDNYILDMRAISMIFPGVKALEDVSLKVRRGTIHAICGENGAGKSTLMKILSGVHPYPSYSGDVYFEGERCEFKSIRDSEARGIVIIHQELALSPYLSIAENIFLGNERSKGGVINWNTTETQAAALMERVGLTENPQTAIVDIGVGKQQLVEIAKALSKRVKLLILDEPTAALNDDDSAHLLELVRQLKAQGITCIMITHKLGEIAAVADTTTVIRDGKTVDTLDMTSGQITEEIMIKGMVGREMNNRYPNHTSAVGEEILRIEDWTVHHPLDSARKVVDSASLTVRRGEIVGLAGLMGAGRTELAMSVFGRAYGVGISGRVYKNGAEVSTRTVSQAVAAGLAYVTEDRKRYGLNLIQTVKENITSVALSRLARWGAIELNAETGVAERYRQELSIKTPSVEVPASKLSGGNQQKIVLAKWIYSEPDVLILDEPTRGIDVGAKYEIYTIINTLADSGKGVLVISSELPELLGICDRIYTLSEGRITGDVPRGEATPESLMTLMTQQQEGAVR
ncbi:MAG: ATP-binding cassette domain-containing protein [Bifidobacteriaceae bacterium]|jgi:putative multiple sugar transport system ATP-binding protein|nr:ATP-binding cassette domain-containing protein [Bifidobacteriaceae bacterium]